MGNQMLLHHYTLKRVKINKEKIKITMGMKKLMRILKREKNGSF